MASAFPDSTGARSEDITQTKSKDGWFYYHLFLIYAYCTQGPRSKFQELGLGSACGFCGIPGPLEFDILTNYHYSRSFSEVKSCRYAVLNV